MAGKMSRSLSLTNRHKKGDEMNILICIKRILDPEIPPTKFKLDSESIRVLPALTAKLKDLLAT